MRTFVLRALLIGAVAAVLAACEGSQSQLGRDAMLPAGRGQGPTPLSGSCLPAWGLRRSWMSPSAGKANRLLYVSGCYNVVDVYDYDGGALMGTLTGFNFPQGQCVDARGDVWIANFGESSSGIGSVVEYAHGASSPSKTFDVDGAAGGCSVSPKGDLAVSIFARDFDSEPGDVEVWRNASGTPKEYVSNDCRFIYPPAYDDKGNLYVEGLSTLMTSYATSACELPAGGKALRTVKVSRRIQYANGAAWDGKYLLLSDQDYNGYATALYQAKEGSAGNLKVVGTTVVSDSRCESSSAGFYEPFIVGPKNTPENRQQGRTLIAGNLACTYRFDFWKYPAGGDPFKELENAPEIPYGQSVSIAR